MSFEQCLQTIIDDGMDDLADNRPDLCLALIASTQEGYLFCKQRLKFGLIFREDFRRFLMKIRIQILRNIMPFGESYPSVHESKTFSDYI